MKNCVIAIDGPAASGKSTIAKLVAEKVGGFYVNTGNMYRAVTLAALRKGIDVDSADETVFTSLLSDLSITYVRQEQGAIVLMMNGEVVNLPDIRSHIVSQNVSAVSRSRAVREAMVGEQRKLRCLGTIIMEGRDIGTNVFPDAEFKFFLTASPETRARRRLAQSEENADNATVASIAREIAERDRIDSQREIAPLKASEDAIYVDSSDMSIDEVSDYILSRIRESGVHV